MISLREIADDSTTLSSTRWAFASIIKFDMAIIALTVIAYIVAHLIGKPFDKDLINGVALLLGLLTGIITTSKALQGFEPKRDKHDAKLADKSSEDNPKGGSGRESKEDSCAEK